MTNENFTPQESIRLIQRMIDKSRQDFSSQSAYFLLWGWCTLFAFIGQFVLRYYFHSRYHYTVWFITIICGIISGVWGYRDRKKAKFKTFVSDSMSYLWIGLGITFFIFCLIFAKIGWYYCYPFYVTLYGVGTFVSGKILQFAPLAWGGILCWIIAVVSIQFSTDVQLLFAAAAVLASYIIPGHLLRQKYRNN